MALPPLPASNTERWFLRYTENGVQHTAICRTADEKTASEVCEAFDAVLTAFGSNSYALTITGLDRAAVGSDIAFPESTTGLAASYGTGIGTNLDRPLQATFTGRSSDGRKSRFGLFGWKGQTDPSWRYDQGENADADATRAALDTWSIAGFFVSISGGRVRYNAYMNVGYNDHYVTKARRGS